MTTLLGLAGALQGLILAGAISSMGGPSRRPNRALGLLLFILSIAVSTITSEHAGFFESSIYPILLEYTLSFFLPPALWYYANTVLGGRAKTPIWVHLLPAALWLAYLAAFAVGLTTWRWLPPIMIVVAYLGCYTLVVAFKAFRGAGSSQTLVSHERVLRAVVVLLAALHLAQVARYLFRSVEALSDIVPLTATGGVFILSALAFRQSRLFAGREPSQAADKYASSTLTPDDVRQTRERLLQTMERDKPFLNENLNLADLAARLAVPRSHLSQVVNSEFDSNFPDFLSRYRVREAERLLADPAWDHLTVEAIGYEVGFRSRSAFHSAFKRLRDETPAQARKRLSSKILGDT